ncbi:MAG: VanZ family protein [Pseudomonadales bacterium]
MLDPSPACRQALLAATVLLFLVATLTPRGEGPRWAVNHVQSTSGMLRLPLPSLLRSSESPIWTQDAIQTRLLRIDLVVEPLLAVQSGPARILTNSANTSLRNLTIAQEGSDLVLRVRRDRQSPNGTPPFVVPGVFEAGVPVSVGLILDEHGLTLDVNGVRRLETAWASGNPFQFWDPGYPIALGNELTWDRPWLGNIWSAELTTPASSVDLLDPGVLEAPVGEWLGSITWLSSSRWDLILNFLFMIPAGFLTSAVRKRWTPARVVLFWMPIVLLAESLQVLIPGRFPAFSDLALNLLGVLVGSAIARRLSRRRSANAGPACDQDG